MIGFHLSLKAHETDDIVLLTGCGLRFQWPFKWNSKTCPVRNCVQKFYTRSDAISHFKEKHAKKSTLCSVCKKPVLMRSFGDIHYHYKRRHPNINIPSYFLRLSTKRSKIDKRVDLKLQTERSKIEWNALNCPLKNCVAMRR